MCECMYIHACTCTIECESDEMILYTEYVFPNNSYIHPKNHKKKNQQGNVKENILYELQMLINKYSQKSIQSEKERHLHLLKERKKERKKALEKY